MDTGTLQTLIRSNEIFQELTPDELAGLLQTSTEVQVRPGDMIFDAGQPGDAMYVILEGRIRILQIFRDGSREILANLEKGQLLGEMAILDGSPRAARAVAVTAATLYRIDREQFQGLREQRNPAAFKLIRGIARLLSRRMRETNWRVVSFFEDPERSLDYLKSRRQLAR